MVVLDGAGIVTAADAPRLGLRYSALSPFVRKVLVAGHETGTIDRIALIATDVWSPETDIAADNPLGKVPALRTPDGPIVGSTLICEYLDGLGGAPILLPAARDARWTILAAHGVADGVMEAAVAHVVERLRRPPERQWDGWLVRQEQKIGRGLDHLASLPAAGRTGVDLFTITLACSLAYLDRRLPALGWRDRHPGLAVWQEDFAQRPSMIATRPPP